MSKKRLGRRRTLAGLFLVGALAGGLAVVKGMGGGVERDVGPGPRSDGSVDHAPRPVEPPPDAPPDTPLATPSVITITSRPTGAKVARVPAGERLGVTPLDLTLPRSGDPFDVEVAKRGFESQRRQIVPDRDQAIEFVLKPNQQYVTVRFNVKPRGADLSVDGNVVTDNPTLIWRSARQHVLRATAPGHESAEQPFLADRNKTVWLSLRRLLPETVAIKFKVTPAGARLWVDGKRIEGDSVRLRRSKTDRHILHAEAPPWRKPGDKEFTASKDDTVELRLAPAITEQPR